MALRAHVRADDRQVIARGYHVSPIRNRDAIAREGLRVDAMGWDAGFIWFFLDRAVAEHAASAGSWGGVRGLHDLWEIDLTGLVVLDDPHPGFGGAWGAASRAVAHSIDAGLLRRVAAIATQAMEEP